MDGTYIDDASYEPADHRASFSDRRQAGECLARRLIEYRGADPVVLGIPRGGVPVAFEVARALDAELDVVVARKLPAPVAPELALGAVTAGGELVLNEGVISELGVGDAELARIVFEQQREARRREGLFRGGREPARIADRIVIVVDDGLATGATMLAVAHALAKQGPAKLIVAVPVCSRSAVKALAPAVDELIYLAKPEPFIAVGHHYEHFEPTRDEEVIRALESARRGLS